MHTSIRHLHPNIQSVESGTSIGSSTHKQAQTLIIDQIEIYQSPIRLKEPFVISLGPLEFAENILIVIHTNEGITGFGECSPFRTIHGESMETCYLVAQYLAHALVGKNPLHMQACILAMDTTIYGNSSIKSAFDMALYDVAAQHAGLPLYAWLGGRKRKTIFTDYTVSFGETGKMAADALKIKENGFPVVKVKLGGTFEKDIERIRTIRETIGPELPIRIDANQGWEPETAISILKALQVFDIQHCEEPIARWNFMELPRIRKESPIPIMADESCCDHHDAKRLLDLKACDLLNVKLGKSGGIFNALKIIQLAEEAGIQVQMGGFLESRLGFTAAAHVALSSDSIVHFDFDTPLMFSEDPVQGGISYGKNGLVEVPDSPGLGASVDESYLQKLQKVVVKAVS